MIQTTLPTKKAIADIVRNYRKLQGKSRGRDLSLRKFAAALTEVLQAFGGGLSHQTVKNWQDRTHLPSPFYMMLIAFNAPADWRRDFARDILAALRPDIYRPATKIGEQAIARGNLEALTSKAARPKET